MYSMQGMRNIDMAECEPVAVVRQRIGAGLGAACVLKGSRPLTLGRPAKGPPRHQKNHRAHSTDSKDVDLAADIQSFLPVDVLGVVVFRVGPGWRGVLRLVSKRLKTAADDVGARDGDERRICPRLCFSRLSAAKWAVEQGCPVTEDASLAAAAVGSVEVLEWLRGYKHQLSPRTCEEAAGGGHLQALQWARSEAASPWDWRACHRAACGGHLEVLKWLRAQGCNWSEETCSSAAGGGHLEALQWLRNVGGCPWDAQTCAKAAGGGHTHVLSWAIDHGCPLSSDVCARAAGSGKTEALTMALERGCLIDFRACSMAAMNGHLDAFMIALERGSSWTIWAGQQAAAAGHIEILSKAWSKGCPWDISISQAAAAAGQTSVLAWLQKCGCPMHTGDSY